MTSEQETLVLDHMNIVYYFANKYKSRLAAGNSYDFDDLVSEGAVALVRAAQRYDPDMGNKFSTYASSYVDGAMKTFLNCKVPTVYFGRRAINAANQIIRDSLVDTSLAEIAESLGVTENTAKAAKEYIFNRRSRSFEEPIYDGSITLGDTLKLSLEVDFEKKLIIENFIQALGDRDSKVASMLLSGASRQDIADELGFTPQHISKIVKYLCKKAEQYNREGGCFMSKLAIMKKLIPKEKLEGLLLENKTSTEIGVMFGLVKSDIETLKQSYCLSKKALGISYFDREDEKIMGNITETVETITETPEPTQTDRPQPKPEAVKMDQPQLQEPKTLELSSARLLEMLGKEGRIVINAQSVVINIGA